MSIKEIIQTNEFWWGFYLILGFICITVFTRKVINSKKIKKCTAETDANVVEIIKRKSRNLRGQSIMCYTPIVEYTVGGTTIQSKSMSIPSESDCYSIGDKIKIAYNPKKTSRCYDMIGEVTKNHRYDMSAISSGIVGSLFIIVTILSIYQNDLEFFNRFYIVIWGVMFIILTVFRVKYGD